MDDENRRSTEQVKLRLVPADAVRLRDAAEASGRTLSEYVMSLHDRQGASVPVSVEPPGASLAVVSRLASALAGLSDGLRLVRGDLGRSLGLVKHLFTSASTAAEAHHVELADAARELRTAIARADEAVIRLEDAMSPLQAEMRVAAKRLAQIR
jgi:hypothetical protein